MMVFFLFTLPFQDIFDGLLKNNRFSCPHDGCIKQDGKCRFACEGHVGVGNVLGQHVSHRCCCDCCHEEWQQVFQHLGILESDAFSCKGVPYSQPHDIDCRKGGQHGEDAVAAHEYEGQYLENAECNRIPHVNLGLSPADNHVRI